ncbi:MAG: tRNA (guanosine(46)-N7)-methyltransferase TrmB [Terrimicrobiaceae bacterium]
MALFQAAAHTLIPFAEAPPDLLPARWQGAGSPPLEIDVGCHKGGFLVEMAQRFPFSNFLGVERQRKRVDKARKKISRLGLANAAVVHGDGLETVAQLPALCADYVHVLFPDPWPKRRHNIRRMVRAEFLGEIARILKRQGLLRLLTDDPDYARAMEIHAAHLAEFQPAVDESREYPPTEFQIKFLADSRPLYGLLLKRVN